MRGGSNWDIVKQRLDRIVHLITYYETRAATTQFELALWQTNMDQADDINPNNREAYRIEVPGPVKETILAYLNSPTDCPSDSEDSSEDDNDNDDESDSSINNDYYDGQQWE